MRSGGELAKPRGAGPLPAPAVRVQVALSGAPDRGSGARSPRVFGILVGPVGDDDGWRLGDGTAMSLDNQ